MHHDTLTTALSPGTLTTARRPAGGRGPFNCAVMTHTNRGRATLPVQPCPIDCAVSAWGAWGGCSHSCGSGSGVQARHRALAHPETEVIVRIPSDDPGGGDIVVAVTAGSSFGGMPCPALQQARECGLQPCPLDCAVSGWSGWEACSEPCGGGQSVSSRGVTALPAFGGVACPAVARAQTCNT